MFAQKTCATRVLQVVSDHFGAHLLRGTAQGLPAGRLVGCKGDDENMFRIVQI